MDTQKTNTPEYILDKISDEVFDITQETIGEARKIAYNTYASVDRVMEIFGDGLLDLKPILAEPIVELKKAIKLKPMIEEIIRFDSAIMGIIETAQERIDQYYYNRYNQVQLCEEAEREFEMLNRRIENCIKDFEIVWYKQIDKEIKVLEKEIDYSINDILVKLRKGQDKKL